MFKDMPMEITWAEAKKIFDTNIAIRGGGGGVLSYGGKWYDVRHMSARHARRQALTDMLVRNVDPAVVAVVDVLATAS